jgi:hypothetical protein
VRTFSELVGQTVGFCGVDGNCLCILVDGARRRWAYEALEDESDGYRSSLKELVSVQVAGKTFFRQPVEDLRVESVDTGSFVGWQLMGPSTGHVWLRIGTDYAHDYYPSFTFDYTPAKGAPSTQEGGAAKAREDAPNRYQEDLMRDACRSAASFIAEIDASSEDVAAYLEQRFGPILRHPRNRFDLEKVATDARKLQRGA